MRYSYSGYRPTSVPFSLLELSVNHSSLQLGTALAPVISTSQTYSVFLMTECARVRPFSGISSNVPPVPFWFGLIVLPTPCYLTRNRTLRVFWWLSVK